jgi:hypothetical protein
MGSKSYSKGISWIDDCRIPFVDEKDKEKNTDGLSRFNDYRGKRIDLGYGFTGGESYEINTQGRFPANLLVSDNMLNDGIIYSSGSGDGKMEMININDAHHFNFIEKNRKVVKMKGVQYNDKGSNSRYYDIDKWFDNLIDV